MTTFVDQPTQLTPHSQSTYHNWLERRTLYNIPFLPSGENLGHMHKDKL